MKLPDLRDFDLKGKGIVLRVDLDVPLLKVGPSKEIFEYKVRDETRLESFVPTVKLLLEKRVKFISLIGHIGRYKEGKKGISTFGLLPTIGKLLNTTISFWPDTLKGESNLKFDPGPEDGLIQLHENLRMYEGEEKNDQFFVKKLANLGDFYINNAFATSHREHASIVGLPKWLPHAAGLHLMQEVESLSKVLENPPRPVVTVLGGVKEDKLKYIQPFFKFSDKILIGGRLPKFVKDKQEGVVVARLDSSGNDLSKQAIFEFEKEITGAGTIILAGPMGKFEDGKYMDGTKKIYQAISQSPAFKLAGGGETEEAISILGLNKKFDWVSSGGGAMLDFLADGDLVGLKALRN